MIAAPHPQQAARLRALQEYEILDTDREKDFDEVVQLAAGICGTAISVINLIDGDRQWFKAEVGLGVRETPLETSLCAHVILEQDFVEIPNTEQDPRMQDNPLVQGEPGLKFYAGALLTAENGLPIGTLCVLDYAPKELTPFQRDALRVLARQVMNQLDLRLALKNATILRQEVDHRVKNSLQSVSSLARVQARAAQGDEARAALEKVQRQIETVAALHEQLYKTDTGAEIDLARYIENVGKFLGGAAPENVRVETDVESALVPSQTAAAVGILMNEFATNSFKHGFPDGRDGLVRFVLRQQPDAMISIHCADNGIGLPADMSPELPSDSAGLGLKVAEAVSQQIGGDLVLSSSPAGFSAHILFPAVA
ncbi:sensor histidine kinase [Phaeovulum sp. W22_SRMD_FR3]|uniref:sensor histidine kinase n=1 Tax=Phaeovulum sp. W22_SRMD_FR3 TaxID=3240274 RepID=UPI003F9DA3D6